MEDALDIDLHALETIGRSSYIGVLKSTGQQVKVVIAQGAEVRPLREAAALRRQLAEEFAGKAGLPVPFPAALRSGPCLFKGSAAWAFVYVYVPGADLTSIVRQLEPGQESEVAHEIGQATGFSLAALHSTSQPLARNRQKETTDAVEHGTTWREATLARQEALARRVHEASKITGLNDHQTQRARSLADMFTNHFKTPRHHEASQTPSCLIHSDLHGGNVVMDIDAALDSRVASFIDDRLSAGDGGYDIASIQDWALEVMDRKSFTAFTHGLEFGYKSLVPDYAMRTSDLLLYLTARSLGRLAYYARSAPKWVEPYGSEHLTCHLDLLGRIAETADSLDSVIDPFATVRRLIT
ncbi:phosphotransferase family protein [Streptomyces sp. MNP-20]|uniref:phosphotransferase family protein n=1 Tax=Streptomyces sp. MNP-20 TaxID=2721165 RepID=UPI0015536890|nr:phosphotransferase [Streptomyces sp. MNP-20]